MTAGKDEETKAKPRTALFIGRFQPFHLGHLNAIEQIFQECSKIVIAVGSAQHRHTKDNPFSYKQREEMIRSVLHSEGITGYSIHPVDDIDDNDRWVKHVNGSVPDYDVVYTGNPLTERLFLEEGIPVRKLAFNIKIHATQLRDLPLDWMHYVHPAVARKVSEYVRKNGNPKHI